MKQCLLIKTPDNRNLFIRSKNVNALEEFAKTFKAKVFSVELKDRKEKLLSNTEFLEAFCDPNFASNAQFTTLETVWPKARRSRKNILSDAKKIHKYIHDRMLKGKVVSLKELKTKYSDKDVSDACLCNHFSQVRKELKTEGYSVKKVGAGAYQIE